MPAITTVAQAQAAGAYDKTNGVGSYAKLPTAPQTPVTPTGGRTSTPAEIAAVNEQAPGVKTAVFSGSTASNNVNSVIAPALTQAQTDLSNHNNNLKLAQGQQFQGGTAQYDFNTGRKLNPGETTQVNPPPAADVPKKEEDPVSDGHYATYNAQGMRSDIPIGTQPADGYSTNKPNNPVVNGQTALKSYEDNNGNKYNQYSDGTYGLTDAQGNFVQSLSGQDFNNGIQGTGDYQKEQYTKTMQDLQSKMLSITTGSYPLNPTQQALVNGVQNQLAQDVAAQQSANQNYTGGVTVAQNLYGLGNTTMGLGAIQKSITDGVLAISNLQSKAAVTVAQMTDDFNKENFSELKDSYEQFNDAQKGIQDHLDTINAAVAKKMEDDRQYKLQVQNQKDTEENQKFTQTMESNKFTYQQKQDAFQNYISSANLTLAQKKQATDSYFQQKNLDLATAKAGLDAANDPNVQSWVTNIKNGDAKFSDVPASIKSAVSAGIASGGDTSQAQAELINQTVDAINTLEKTPGKSAAVGSNVPSPWSVITDPADSFGFKGFPGSKSAGYLAQLNQVKSLIALPNLKLLKGVGRITDKEFAVLQSAETTLNKDLPESVFDAELAKVKSVFQQKQQELNTTHNGVQLPTNLTTDGSSYNGITLPN